MFYQVLIWTVGEVINYKIYLPSTSKAMAGRGKKRARQKHKKFEYLKNGKSFLDEIKNIFIVFERLSFG